LERRPGPPPSVEEIVRAFLAPAFNLKRRGAGGIAFLRLQARMQNEPPELTQELRTFVYEESVQRCIKALRRALPDVDPKTIFWRITFVAVRTISARRPTRNEARQYREDPMP
jgi:hypothetical protein